MNDALAETASGIRFANPPSVHAPLGRYSHVVSVPPGHRLLVIAGQTGHAPDGTLPDTFVAQFRNAIANVVAILASEGATPGSLVKLNTYAVQTTFDRAALADVRREFLGEIQPAATFAYVSGLYLPELLVEVEAWAAVRE